MVAQSLRGAGDRHACRFLAADLTEMPSSFIAAAVFDVTNARQRVLWHGAADDLPQPALARGSPPHRAKRGQARSGELEARNSLKRSRQAGLR